MNGESSLGTPATSPFSPHFGRTPWSLVGRDDLLADLGNGLATGPADARYTSVLMGVRGSGKTVLLNEIEDRAAADGWVVLSLDAGTPGLVDRIVNAVCYADDTYDALDAAGVGRTRSVEKGVGLRLGLVEGTVATREYRDRMANMGLREHLSYLSRAAGKCGTSVLLTVDELHGIDRVEGRRLSNDLQHITKRAGMPLAFLGAGLLEMKTTLLRDRKMTFFHRCEHFEMPPLETGDAMVGLARPIREAGGEISGEALRLASQAVGSSPYRLQVIGDLAWKLAGAPENPIGVRSVDTAIDAAGEVVRKKVSIPAWHDLSSSERSILAAVAAAGGAATPAGVASGTRISSGYANETLGRLKDAGYLDQPRHGAYRLTELVPAEVVASESGLQDLGDAQPSHLNLEKCRKWMPRARTHCVLNAGHSGGCRSK